MSTFLKNRQYIKSNIKNDSLFIREEKLQLKKAQLNTSITLEQLKNEHAAVNLLAELTKEREDVFQKIQMLMQEIDEKYPNLKTKYSGIMDYMIASKTDYEKLNNLKVNTTFLDSIRNNSLEKEIPWLHDILYNNLVL